MRSMKTPPGKWPVHVYIMDLQHPSTAPHSFEIWIVRTSRSATPKCIFLLDFSSSDSGLRCLADSASITAEYTSQNMFFQSC